MNKKLAKKDHLIRCGLDVMKRHGYNGTSVKDIVEAASVPKGSFYTYFDSKESFATEAIASASEQAYQECEASLLSLSGDPIERLVNYFKVGAEQARDNQFSTGCFIGNMCQEMADSNDAIRAEVQNAMAKQVQLIAKLLAAGQTQGSLCTSVNCEDMAEFLLCAWQGTLLKMKAAKSDCPLQAFLRTLPTLLSCPE